jgi:small-conductance mechanosensitive channel
MYNLQKYYEYILPAAFIVGGIIIGFIIEKIIFSMIRKKTGRESKYGEIAISSMRGILVLLFLIIGIWVVVEIVPMSAGLHGFLVKVLLVIVIFSVTFVISRAAAGFIKFYSHKTAGVLPATSLFVNITYLVIYSIGLMVILQTLGISITPVLTALGVGGLAVALALQDTLSNLFAGLHIIASGNIKTGDYIEVEGGYAGFVSDITWRNTTIKVLPNNLVVIPNKKLAESVIINYSLPEQELSVLVQMGVGYSSDLRKVERVTKEVISEVMKEVEGGVPEFTPVIRFHTFGDSSIQFTVVMRAKEFANQFLLKHEFIKRVHERYRKEKIEIPFPIRTVFLKNK